MANQITNWIGVAGIALFSWFLIDYYLDKQAEQEHRRELEARYSSLLNSVQEFATLEKELASLRIKYAEQQELLLKTADQWPDLRDKHERVKSVGAVTVRLPSGEQKQVTPDYQFTTPKGESRFSIFELRVAGPNSPPIGYVRINSDGSVNKQSYPINVQVEQVQFKDDLTGKVRVISRAYLLPVENGLAGKRRPDWTRWAGRKYKLGVTEGELVIDPKEPIDAYRGRKDWVLLPLNINGGIGVIGDGSSINSAITTDVTLLGWGSSKYSLDYKFFNIGGIYNDTDGVGVAITPATLRPLPTVLTNTYLGVGYGAFVDTSNYFINLSVGF